MYRILLLALIALLCNFTLRKGKSTPHKVVWFYNNVHNRGWLTPTLNSCQFLVEDKGFRVSWRPKRLIEAIYNILRFVINNSDIGWFFWEMVGDHHVIVNFADLASDLYVHDAFDLNVSFLLITFSWVMIEIQKVSI